MKTASSSPQFNYGFPTPGPQSPSGQDVVNHVFFLSQGEWKRAREEEQFDYVVIGSGFCALGFVERALKNDPHARILILERGGFFLPEHFQNLPLPYQSTLGGLSETFPWTLSAETHNSRFIKWQHGMVPFFGGRSIMWSAWCPRPTPEEMNGWPEEMIAVAQEYFAHAEKLLNVIPADEIDKGPNAVHRPRRPIFGVMQDKLTSHVQKNLHKIESATRALAAPLAVGARDIQVIDFDKFSTPGPLLAVADRQRKLALNGKGSPLRIATDCIVTRILEQNGKATALETTRGIVNVNDSKVILAMGTLPPTTLIHNSFPQVKNVGERFSAHFITAVVARVPRKDFSYHKQISDLELGAIYIAGEDKKTKGQYHVQLSILSDKEPEKNAQAAARYMPDVVATASPEQLSTSEDYLVFVCAVLGELDYKNKNNWFRRNDGTEPTTNVTLQVLENENDSALWDIMDEGTFQLLENVLSPRGKEQVEYWHTTTDGNGTGRWVNERPPVEQIRVPGLVHECSTMWIGKEKDDVVGLDYRPKGVENVYITGASLWPTAGSWNPTMTMVAFAQHLADSLNGKPVNE
jgi:choline dehydrogenase-like flavoprotein